MDVLTKMSVGGLCEWYVDNCTNPEERGRVISELERRISENKPNIPADQIMVHGGRVVKVLGKLPETADGCVAAHGADVHWNNPEGHTTDGVVKYYVRTTDSHPSESWVPIRLCFCTREAAEAARAKEGK